MPTQKTKLGHLLSDPDDGDNQPSPLDESAFLAIVFTEGPVDRVQKEIEKAVFDRSAFFGFFNAIQKRSPYLVEIFEMLRSKHPDRQDLARTALGIAISSKNDDFLSYLLKNHSFSDQEIVDKIASVTERSEKKAEAFLVVKTLLASKKGLFSGVSVRDLAVLVASCASSESVLEIVVDKIQASDASRVLVNMMMEKSRFEYAPQNYKPCLLALYQKVSETMLSFSDEQLNLFAPREDNPDFWSIHDIFRSKKDIAKVVEPQSTQKQKKKLSM